MAIKTNSFIHSIQRSNIRTSLQGRTANTFSTKLNLHFPFKYNATYGKDIKNKNAASFENENLPITITNI